MIGFVLKWSNKLLFLTLHLLALLGQAPLGRVLRLLVCILVGVRVKLARAVGARVEQFPRVRRHVLLQADRPLEDLVAVLALERSRGVHVLLVFRQSLLAVEHPVADVAEVPVVGVLVSQQVLVECVSVL